MPVAELNPPSPIVNRKSEEVVVSVRGLTKVFKDFWNRPKARAVDNVDFDVRRGEVFGLLGPNGSGKSTTVKLLLGLLHPTRGQIEVFGHSPRHVQTKSRIGYLPEESYLYRYLNSRETLDFFGNLFQLDKNERNSRIEQLLEMVGLNQVHLRSVGEFSKGMQRRIGLAQALINDPDLVILDEPTSGLDPIGCREVKDLILALARRGKTVILSSHLLSDVENVCDRVVIYYGGKIQAMGALKDLLATPDAIRITTPALPRETMERVLEIIRRDVAADKVRIDTPTQKPGELLSRRGAKGAPGRGGNFRRHFRRPRGGLPARRGGGKTARRENSGTTGPATGGPAGCPVQTGSAGCHRAEGGRQKTGSADKSRRINATGWQAEARGGRKAGGFVKGGRETLIVTRKEEAVKRNAETQRTQRCAERIFSMKLCVSLRPSRPLR